MRITLIILAAVLVIGGSVIAMGFLTNPEPEEEQAEMIIPKEMTPYEKLQKYKEELEKINRYNKQMLVDLEKQLENSEGQNIEQLEEEIDILKRVISENADELKTIAKQLSEMQSGP